MHELNNSSIAFKCQICQNTQAEFMIAQELMFNTRDVFQYAQCTLCGCLQLLDKLADYSKYYPTNYYSFSDGFRPKFFKKMRRGLKRKLILFHWDPFSKLINGHVLFWAYRKLGMKTDWKVLDVGAGSGSHVLELRSAGIKAVGIDPFLEKNLMIDNELVVEKQSLRGLKSQFNLITFHHSFEHIPNQLETLQQAKDLLTEDGFILIRIPTVSSEAYKTYRENWYQLDAPRHLFLHSHTSIKLIAHQANLKVIDLWCDSTEGQFIGSENYRAMTSGEKLSVSTHRPIKFSRAKIATFKKMTREFNQKLSGDQICVILQAS